MTETMQAVVCHGPRDYRLEEVPRPTRARARHWYAWRPSASAPAI